MKGIQRQDAKAQRRKENQRTLAPLRPGGFAFSESVVEEAALAWLESLGYAILHGPDVAPGEPFAERFLTEVSS